MQSLLGGPHVEVISYSQFKSLLKKDLIADLVIDATTIQGNLKGGAAKEIFPPEKLKSISSDVLTEKSLPFAVVRVEDPGLTAELEAAKVPFKGHVSNSWLPAILSWV
ncbi:MAG TPA: ATP-dependent metallopeptidase FtsH/Yme1/Tma family protein, partial [Candidatus Binatia bacterium]|nr:ATP-dependent metallopeptidase FtsH/Yme1/Tma family protein [Candidatus Binatia bacterium]